MSIFLVSPLSFPLAIIYIFPYSNFCISSQFEEKFEEINSVEAPLSIPPASPVIECQATVVPEESRENGTAIQGPENTIYPNENESHEIANGIMKIVPDVNVSHLSNIFLGHHFLGHNKYFARPFL